jgi:hypothetical protein
MAEKTQATEHHKFTRQQMVEWLDYQLKRESLVPGYKMMFKEIREFLEIHVGCAGE